MFVPAWMNIIDPDGLKTATQMYNAHVATRGVSEYNLNVTYTHKDGHDVSLPPWKWGLTLGLSNTVDGA